MNIINQFTLRTLLKNKTRTLVTIIGIALSAAMFTGVVSTIVSFQNYMLREEIARNGAWEAKIEGCNASSAELIKNDEAIKGYTQMAHFGYAKLEGCVNEDKPYLFVIGVGKNITDYYPIHLVEGRMPENNTEVIIPAHLKINGEVDYKVGDVLHLDIGKRVFKDGDYKGEPVGGQNTPFQSGGEGGEAIADTISKVYTIVGICERPSIEPYTAPGYTVMTLDNGADAPEYGLALSFKKPSELSKTMKRLTEKCQEGITYAMHNALLRYKGSSTNDNYNRVMYNMAAILMLVILLGSVSLIYNAFSISVSERTKQFGLLKSIGATKKQMRHSVFFEASVLGLVGIPLGILAGLGGMGITFYFIADMISYLWSGATEKGVYLKLIVTWQAVAFAAVIAFTTVLISAFIPAIRAVKLSPIQAIRQSGDVRIRPEKVRTSGLTYRLFGFEGMLSSKNFKRSRKKYRTTVFSLFISIVLFVTATSFTNYLTGAAESTNNYSEYDISFYLTDDNKKNKIDEEIAKEIEELTNVDEVGYSQVADGMIRLPREYINEEFLKLFKNEEEKGNTGDDAVVSLNVTIRFVRDSVYQRYLKKEGLNELKYIGSRKKTALIWDYARAYVDDKLINLHILKKANWNGKVYLMENTEEHYYVRTEGDKYVFGDKYGEEKAFSAEEAFSSNMDITFGEVQDKTMPLGASAELWNGYVTLVMPYSAIPDDLTEKYSTNFNVRAENHKKAYGEIIKYLSGPEFDNEARGNVYDEAESKEAEKMLILVINIFSYGFIILISLISVANVFNTISTNINLRRQEFAMLKSVGMTGRGFRKMMNYECALYGLKGILYGVPVSCLISWFMYSAMDQGINTKYVLPWQGILVSSICVFLVVFATMLYSMSKVKKDNTIEALRNENL